MLFDKGALLLLAASQVTLPPALGFVAPWARFGLSQGRCSFVTSPSKVAADPVEASEESVVDEVAETSVPEISSEDNTVVDEVAETSVPEISSEDNTVAEEAEEKTPKRRVLRERNTAFVGNLNFDSTDSEIKDLFAEYGKVQVVNIPRNQEGRSRGFAFVDMSTKEEVQAAVKGLSETEFGGRTIRVVESVPKEQLQKQREEKAEAANAAKIYVGNLSFDATTEDLYELYGQYGEVKDVYLPLRVDTGRPRGFAFVTIDPAERANAIEATNGMEFQGRTLSVSEPLPPGQKSPRAESPSRTKLYVGNLSFYTTLETVQEEFEKFGVVHDCYMPSDRETGGSRGFAFVTMDPEAANEAIMETDGCELDGRFIRVNEAQPKYSERPSYSQDDDQGYSDEGGYDDYDDEYSDDGAY